MCVCVICIYVNIYIYILMYLKTKTFIYGGKTLYMVRMASYNHNHMSHLHLFCMLPFYEFRLIVNAFLSAFGFP